MIIGSLITGDFNAKIGREEVFRPTIGKYSLHEMTIYTGQRLIDMATTTNLLVKFSVIEHKRIQ